MNMYDKFVKVMTANNIEPLYKDYEASLQMYEDDCKNGETDFSFEKWLENYVAHAIMDGYH